MRISVDPDSPYFDADAVFRALIRLDGELLYHCVEADSDAGRARCIVPDERGRPSVDEYGAIRYEIKRGHVEITIPPKPDLRPDPPFGAAEAPA